MEKPTKMKARILAILPKAAYPVTFQSSPPWSPRGKSAAARGPVIPIIPVEVRGQPKTDSFVAREPNSPEISCTGRVKNKKRKSIGKPKIVLPPVQESKPISSPREVEKKPVLIANSFKDTKQDHKTRAADKEPSFGHIKQYASSRGTLKDFNWKDIVENREVEK